MGEREAMREREAEPLSSDLYDEHWERLSRWKEIRETGKVVVKGSQIPFQQGRQAVGKFLLHPMLKDRAIEIVPGPLLRMAVQEFRTQSGRHIHQGNLALFILQGKGYTVVDGERYDWEEGDLVLLPMKPGGVEHQHFSTDPDKPSRWLSIIPQLLVWDICGYILEQKEEHPNWKGEPPKTHVG